MKLLTTHEEFCLNNGPRFSFRAQPQTARSHAREIRDAARCTDLSLYRLATAMISDVANVAPRNPSVIFS